VQFIYFTNNILMSSSHAINLRGKRRTIFLTVLPGGIFGDPILAVIEVLLKMRDHKDLNVKLHELDRSHRS
jgi:hypothetical protein